MVVVEMHDDRRQIEALRAAVPTGTRFHRIEAVKKPVEIAGWAARFTGQPVHRFVGGPERAGRVLAGEVVAKRLLGSLVRSVANELRQFPLRN